MRRLVSAIPLCALLVLAQPARAGTELNDSCNAPAEFVTTDASLAQLAAAISAGGPIDILAVGSATTVGSLTTAGEHSASQGGAFPWHMVRALHAALPSVEFRLTVRGGRGMTAEQMLPLIDAALKQQRHPLVLWQTGTVEAVRGLQPDGMLDVLHTGAERVRDAGGDLVLVDPQFSRFLRANTDLDPYENVMQQVATMPGVALFHRFDLMRAWANDGRIDLERTPKADRDKALEEMNVCLGKALARFVLSAADVTRK
jgi:acyl-CoA thioesterase I